MDKIKFDFNNMMANRLGDVHGIKEEEINKIMPQINSALDKALERKWGFMKLPYDKDLVNKINNIMNTQIKGKFSDFVAIGIGGSSLGARALQNSLADNNINVHFAENIDPSSINELLNKIDCKKTMFNVITKSGGTAETISNFMVLRRKLIDLVGEDEHKKHIIITTDPQKGELRKIANSLGYLSLDVSPEVGGRFSVLTSVGLLPAAVMGIDIDMLLGGAKYIDEVCKNKDVWKNPACLLAVLQYLFYKKKRNVSVLMPYSDRLKGLAEWYCQLWAESLGKNDKVGSTPVRTLGVIDQHSQLQLYMEGPHDKVITFIKVEDFGVTVKIPKDLQEFPGISYLGGHTLNELITAEQKASELALVSSGRPCCTITFSKVSPFTVGAFMYLLEMQTAYIGELFQIDAFNQPGVELGKKITGALMGRPGYEKNKELIDNIPEAKDKYVI